MPSVSVIIPNYNHSRYLTQRIESVLNQTYQDLEVLLLDDCSTDNSREVLTRYKDHPKVAHLVLNETNSGSTFMQWNKGVGLATGEYIWIAESDDVAEPTFLEKLVEGLKQPSVGVAYCQSTRMDSEGKIEGTWKTFTDDLDPTLFEHDFTQKGTDYIKKFLLSKNTLPNASAILFRKDLYLKVGSADPSVRYCSDWLLWLKMLSSSDVFFVSSPLNHFRFHSKSVIASVKGQAAPYDIFMRKKWREFLLGPPAKKELLALSDQALSNEYLTMGVSKLNAGQKWEGMKAVLYSALYPRVRAVAFLQRLNYCLSQL